MVSGSRLELDSELERRKPGSQWPRPVSLAPSCRAEIGCHHSEPGSTLGCWLAPTGAVMRFVAGGLWAGSCCGELSRSSFRGNVFPTVWPSELLTSRPAIRVNSLGRQPPIMVMSVTVIRSENERAQPINRPCGPRICTGRAPFSEKFSGSLRSIGASPGRDLSLGHDPAELLGGAP